MLLYILQTRNFEILELSKTILHAFLSNYELFSTFKLLIKRCTFTWNKRVLGYIAISH